jgi:hypothetical protein
MGGRSDNAEGFEEKTHFVAGEGVERARHTVREHLQQGSVYERSECLVAGHVGRLFIRNFANLQDGALCKFAIGLIGP